MFGQTKGRHPNLVASEGSSGLGLYPLLVEGITVSNLVFSGVRPSTGAQLWESFYDLLLYKFLFVKFTKDSDG